MNWTPICKLSDILPGAGVCALVAGQQIAVFRVADGVYALSNFDPFTRAYVLSRGLTGSYGGRPKVASPLLKHAFDLTTGVSLDDPSVRAPTFPVRVEGGEVWIGSAA